MENFQSEKRDVQKSKFQRRAESRQVIEEMQGAAKLISIGAETLRFSLKGRAELVSYLVGEKVGAK